MMKRFVFMIAVTAATVSNVMSQTGAAKVVPEPGGNGAAKNGEPGREAVITAERIEFDNKEGIILFDENVLVDDEQFIMRSERLLVFLEGTNDVQQIMAVGSVVITNQNRTASCDKAVYTKKDGQIVMTGNARLMRQGEQGGEITGTRIVFWLDDERMEVSPGRVVLPPGTFKKAERSFMP
ncbi:MAG: LptA/OstA family protein [Kiritimatiellae bacterium]|nr:LptA/OstA family protein [Kiritimatiellia bacterium]MDD4621625.1 LptA/OstA family protein [Kiritimatiellia bacterium]